MPVQEVEIQREEMRLKSCKLDFLLDRILNEMTEGFCSLTHLSCQFSSREMVKIDGAKSRQVTSDLREEFEWQGRKRRRNEIKSSLPYFESSELGESSTESVPFTVSFRTLESYSTLSPLLLTT